MAFRIHVKAFTLPDVQVGSILDFRYSLRYPDKRVLAPEWIVQDRLFQKKATFKFIPSPGGLGQPSRAEPGAPAQSLRPLGQPGISRRRQDIRMQLYITLPHDQIANNVSWTTLLPAQYKPQQHSLPVSSMQTAHGTAAYWVDLAIDKVPAS